MQERAPHYCQTTPVRNVIKMIRGRDHCRTGQSYVYGKYTRLSLDIDIWGRRIPKHERVDGVALGCTEGGNDQESHADKEEASHEDLRNSGEPFDVASVSRNRLRKSACASTVSIMGTQSVKYLQTRRSEVKFWSKTPVNNLHDEASAQRSLFQRQPS